MKELKEIAIQILTKQLGCIPTEDQIFAFLNCSGLLVAQDQKNTK